MATDDDDNPFNAAPPAGSDPTAGVDAEDDAADGPFDMQLFASMFHKKGIASQTIRKGQKDFESHGTRAQDNALEASRRVIEEVLGYTRMHKDDWNQGWYFPDYWPAALEEMASGTADEPARPEFVRNMDPSIHVRDRVVVMDDMKGPQGKSVGRTIKGLKPPRPAAGKVWLLPEEALFMLERGSLDLWWPDKELRELMPSTKSADAESSTDPAPSLEGEADEFAKGVPLSLQAAYAMLIGAEGERGKITLPRYQVYAHLKRSGYFVQRAPESSLDGDSSSSSIKPGQSLWQWLFSLVGNSNSKSHASFGPLLRPGVYRNYATVYKQLELIPRFKPSDPPADSSPPEDPFKVFYHVWRPSTHQVFSKSDPPPPDFRIAVVDARDTCVPALDQLDALFGSTPSDPPDAGLVGPGRMYPRLKHGHRNVLISIVDRGLVNFMRFGQAAFGEEKLYERFDAPNRGRGGKRGGRGGRGRGRGGRGGRGRGG